MMISMNQAVGGSAKYDAPWKLDTRWVVGHSHNDNTLLLEEDEAIVKERRHFYTGVQWPFLR